MIDELNISVDRKLLILLNIWSVVLFLMLTVSGLFISSGGSISITFSGLFIFFIILVITSCLHECIHGIFFKIFAPRTKVQYGFKSGLLYAANPGMRYTKQQFTMITIMPFVVITFLICLSLIFPIHRMPIYMLFVIHTSGCVGDFYYCYKLWRNNNRSILIEDTAEGIKIYEELKANDTIEK